MRQEDKELLLKDLCARLHYGVKGIITYDESNTTFTVEGIDNNVLHLSNAEECYIEDFKPYLRPVSSMPQKEKSELYEVFQECPTIIKTFPSHAEFFIYADIIDSIDMVNVIDWLNAHHFDYRGLIEKGLALEAKEGMYNI